MFASIATGSQREFALTGALRRMVAGLFGTLTAGALRPSDRIRMRAREANDVRQLARSLEPQLPGFAADLYAAAARHDGFAD